MIKSPPKPFVQVSPSVLMVKEGGGCLSIFGLPFLVSGMWVIAMGLGLVRAGTEVNIASKFFLVIFGTVFAGVGGFLVLGRRWITIDTFKRQIITQFGLMVPMRKKIDSISAIEAVALLHSSGDSDTSDSYPIELLRKGGEKTLRIANPLSYADARAAAAHVATFLHLPLQDKTTDAALVARPWEEGPLSFMQIEDQDDFGSHVVNRPPEALCKVEDREETLSIRAPFQPVPFVAIVFAFVPFIFFLVFVKLAGLRFNRFQIQDLHFDFHKVEDVFGFAFLLFLLLFLWGIVVQPLRAFWRHYSRSKDGYWMATLSPRGLVIEDTGPNKIIPRHIEIGDIVSVEARLLPQSNVNVVQNPRIRGAFNRYVQRQNSIIIKTKTDILSFPLGLTMDETRYIVDMLRRRIATY